MCLRLLRQPAGRQTERDRERSAERLRHVSFLRSSPMTHAAKRCVGGHLELATGATSTATVVVVVAVVRDNIRIRSRPSASVYMRCTLQAVSLSDPLFRFHSLCVCILDDKRQRHTVSSSKHNISSGSDLLYSAWPGASGSQRDSSESYVLLSAQLLLPKRIYRYTNYCQLIRLQI